MLAVLFLNEDAQGQREYLPLDRLRLLGVVRSHHDDAVLALLSLSQQRRLRQGDCIILQPHLAVWAVQEQGFMPIGPAHPGTTNEEVEHDADVRVDRP